MISPAARTGRHFEDRALAYLRRQGLTLEARNFRCRRGEIDLIMRDGTCTIFVEVRYRRHRRFGGALISVDRGKRMRLARSALLYLMTRDGDCERPMRFDVVAFDGHKAALRWVQNAFEFD